MKRIFTFLSLRALPSLLYVFTLGSATAQTSLAPQKIADLNPGSDGSFPSNLTVVATSLLFDANTPSTGTELWKFDGAQIGLAADINDTTVDFNGVPIGNSSNPNWLTPFNGALYFSAWEPRHGAELWRYDGSGAVRAADINPDANDSIKANPNSSWPSNLTVFNNALYFTANGGSRTNYELWKYDGNTASLAANIHPDIGLDYSSYPDGLTVFNGALYFMADDGSNGYELWRYNGTKALLVTNINPGSASSYPKYFTAVNTQLYFQAYHSSYGYELWKTDGATVSLIDINPGADGSYPSFLTAFNGALYFSATDGVHGYELWKYDGSTPTLAADINPGGDSFPKNLIVFNNALYFTADDGVHGWELWRYNGATAELVADLNPSGDSFPENLTVFDGELYFSATTFETGYEVWKCDGNSVTLAADINPGPGDSYPRSFTPFGQQLVFAAAGDGASDWELWTLAPQTANLPPMVALTSPTNGSTFLSTDTVTVSANASDDGTVSKVEFYANGNLVGAATAAPYSVSTTLVPGTYSITAEATDNLGLSTVSSAVTIGVQGPANQPPTIALSSPQSGQVIAAPGTVVLTATASDSDGTIAQVEFFSGSSSLKVASSSPYQITINDLPAGVYSLYATATDDQGAKATSSNISVRVVNQPRITLIASGSGSSHLEATGTSGVPEILEASSDLTNWTAVSTNVPSGGMVTFVVPASSSTRFYRIIVR